MVCPPFVCTVPQELFKPEVNGTVAANLLRFLGKPEDTPIDFARIDRKWCCD